MPQAPKKPCPVYGCKQTMPCSKHHKEKAKRWGRDTRPNAAARGYGRDWTAVRKAVLKRDRFECRKCGKRAVLVHHVEAISGPDDPKRLDAGNCVSLCRACHEAVHGRA